MESFDDWTILELKDYLLQHDILIKDINGKNGNVVRKDLIKAVKKIHQIIKNINYHLKNYILKNLQF